MTEPTTPNEAAYQPAPIVLSRSRHPFMERIAHQCLDCGVAFVDNNRTTKRCQPCRLKRRAHLKRLAAAQKRSTQP